MRYLDALVRGVYARHDLPAGHVITDNDVYLSIPLLQGQISCRELMRGEVLLKPVKADASIDITDIDSPYAAVQVAAGADHGARPAARMNPGTAMDGAAEWAPLRGCHPSRLPAFSRAASRAS